jgi:hypothetical protein
MIICYFNLMRISVGKPEADAPLVVYRNRVLSFPVALQAMKTIARGHPQIIDARRQVNIFQPPYGSPDDIRLQSFRFPCCE